ncbi:MAG: BrnA antitoxin family protein [Treponema sp.]|jgi:uncharacterized protein (DUF4415 family)|nr:BrnA antitoxin family protein [Treponema sp.]
MTFVWDEKKNRNNIKAPPVNRKALARLAAMKDEDIDYSDIPPLDTLELRPRPIVDRSIYRPVKVALTCRLDADIVAWLKRGGKGYQTRLNAILRQAMTR